MIDRYAYASYREEDVSVLGRDGDKNRLLTVQSGGQSCLEMDEGPTHAMYRAEDGSISRKDEGRTRLFTEQRMVLLQGRMEARPSYLQYRAEDGSISRKDEGRTKLLTVQSGGWSCFKEGWRQDQVTYRTERRMVLSQGRMEARPSYLQNRAEDGSISRKDGGKTKLLTEQSGGWFYLKEGWRQEQVNYRTERRMVLLQGRIDIRPDLFSSSCV
jgi:hypothetical protein